MKGARLLVTRSSPLRARIVAAGFLVVLVTALLVAAPPSSAADLAGSSNTYLQSRETTDGSKLLPAYEYLDLTVRDMGDESISTHLGGWLRYDFRAEESGRKINDDLQYAYISIRDKSSDSAVKVGRVLINEGIASDRVDGVYARTDLLGGFGASAYAGSAAETNTDATNSIVGARVSHHIAGLYTVGLSYLKENAYLDGRSDAATSREQEGVDLWIRPVDKVEVMGRSAYNVLSDGWMNHDYSLVLGPFAKLHLTTTASKINYKDYFGGTTTSVFAFQPGGPIDPNEKVAIVGEEANYAVTDRISASADYKDYDYDLAGRAKYYGARIGYLTSSSGSVGASVHRMDGDTDRLSYNEYRIYSSRKIDRADIALDLLDVKYDEPINGVTNAYSAAAAIGYELTEAVKVGADLEYAKNPDFDKDVRLFVKMQYRFDTAGRRAGESPTREGVQ